MFSLKIVSSDAFLEMPASSRELYFQLGMYADDDGFVSPKKIMRMVGASEDDLKVLLAKRFLLAFESGVVVIKHWLIHNLMRADRYTETDYIVEKATLKLNGWGAYTDKDGAPLKPIVKPLLPTRQPDGNQMAPQVRLSKDKIVNTVALPAPTQWWEEIRSKADWYRTLVMELAAHDYWGKTRIHLIVIDEFIPYWLEKGEKHKKSRWEKEKVFEPALRIRNWIKMAHERNKDWKCLSSQVWHQRGEKCHHTKETTKDDKPYVLPPEIAQSAKLLAEKKKM